LAIALARQATVTADDGYSPPDSEEFYSFEFYSGEPTEYGVMGGLCLRNTGFDIQIITELPNDSDIPFFRWVARDGQLPQIREISELLIGQPHDCMIEQIASDGFPSLVWALFDGTRKMESSLAKLQENPDNVEAALYLRACLTQLIHLYGEKDPVPEKVRTTYNRIRSHQLTYLGAEELFGIMERNVRTVLGEYPELRPLRDPS